MRSIFLCLLFSLALTCHCFASQESVISNSPIDALDYYTQPGGVYIAPNGIFILFNEKLIQVSLLNSDGRGIFVPAVEMSRRFVWCPFCEHWYDPDEPHDCK